MRTQVQPEYLTLTEAAAKCSLNPRTLRRQIAIGLLPACRIGRAVRIKVSDLDAWMASNIIPTFKAAA